jgi:hypothetical protein
MGTLAKKMRDYKTTEEKVKRLIDRKRPLVDKLRRLEMEIWGRDKRLTTQFRQRVREAAE